MTDVKWIKIATDLFDNDKITLIRSEEDADALILIWIHMLCLAGRNNNRGRFLLNPDTPYTEHMLSVVLGRDEKLVHRALELFTAYGMVRMDNGVITIANWNDYQKLDALEKKNVYQRNYMRTKRGGVTPAESGKEKAEAVPEVPFCVGEIPTEAASCLGVCAADPAEKEAPSPDGKAETRASASGKKAQTDDTGKKTAVTEADVYVAFAGSDTPLLSALKEFDTMRAENGKPMTAAARKLLTDKLRTYPPEDWISILKNSVLHSWKDIYPLSKNGRQSNAGSTGGAAAQHRLLPTEF